MVKFDILTLFPEQLMPILTAGILGRGMARGHLGIEAHQIRAHTTSKQGQVDDYPYGGGMGMVMSADPLYRCLEHVTQSRGPGRVILMSPAGKPFTQDAARGLAAEPHIILVCGRYEGIDQRFIDECVDEELSLGDFVLTGGEIAAAAVCDAVGRLIPGVLADESCFENESHWDGLLEHPQYTRPAVWRGRAVPDVLTSGDHRRIEEWRREQSLRLTSERRPDMLKKERGGGA
ncbi:MAG: tRNA (guanosine(37)-N1)-methyltransferase TrmD [Oscillospiraceae bacterium]|nr:tRNA (guanosine(37)-N1)-methyltransferase TrmD [Oscillospiraceae bacterium]